MSVVERVKQDLLPLILETVLELRHGISVGMDWDGRSGVPRSLFSKSVAVNGVASPIEKPAGHEEIEQTRFPMSMNNDVTESVGTAIQEPKLHMVCRPKVGGLVKGGGFVGMWKKMLPHA